MDKIQALFIFYPLLLFCLSFHEAAHALVANRLGDPTAKMLGRITLNPIPHMDIIGTVFLPVMALMTGAPIIGWGKPVPVDPRNFKDERRDSLWVAAAGPISNITLAILFSLVLRGLLAFVPHLNERHLQEGVFTGDALRVVVVICQMGVFLNLILAFFNLIPLFPLDGGSVLRGLLPESALPAFDNFSRYSFLILLGLFILGFLRYVLIPVQWVSSFLLP
ncbi:MAG: site-2 protease family protein [Deltaproteobacteria bacterium]|nr:site-2 protease family protein [Deltaproteobacteria bacterium]MDZ4225060.1 site-2 protease family protein [bacterium]